METLEFYLGSSRFLTLLFILIYWVPLTSLLWLDIFLIFKILILGIVLYFFKKNYTLHINRNNQNAVIKVWQDSKGNWGFQTKKGRGHKAILLLDSYQSSYLILLRLKTLNKIVHILIPYDCLKQTEYKLLIRCLMGTKSTRKH